MTGAEWTILGFIIGGYIQLPIYYKFAVKHAEKVKTELLNIRENDLEHINGSLEQIREHIFTLAKKD